VTPEEARILAVLGRELFVASAGTPLWNRMRRPRPGDLVLEISGFGRGWDPDRIGRLVRVEGKPPDDRYVVDPLHDPARRQSWQHAEFIALPTLVAEDWLLLDEAPVRTRYQPLADYLLQYSRERIELSFDDIESVLGSHLPPSARNPRLIQWWDNDSGNEQAQAWMSAGYEVERIDITNQLVTFRFHSREASPPTR
jgi:hypothetical protein